jgi:hypothetical protein
MAIVPVARGAVMAYTGVGLEARLPTGQNQPHVLDVVPRTAILGKTTELEIWGSNLNPKNKSLTAKIANKPVQVNAASDELIVVNIASLSAQDGSANVVLMYNGTEGARGVVKLTNPPPPVYPPDLVITSFSWVPSSPVLGNNVHATITVLNQGRGPAGLFGIMWKPYANIPAGLITPVQGMNAGDSKSFGFDFSRYPNAGTFDTLAIVDYLNQVSSYKSVTKSIIVQAVPKQTKWTWYNFEADQWGGITSGWDQRHDYTVYIPIDSGWHWDGDTNSVKNSLTYTTSSWGSRGPPSAYVIDDPVFVNGCVMGICVVGVKVNIHVGAGSDWANPSPHIYITIRATEVQN